MARTFSRDKFSRNRVVAWDTDANNGKGGAVTTDDCIREDGSINDDMLAKYKIDRDEVYVITAKTMGEPYSTGPGSAMLEHLAKSRDEEVEDTLVQLCLQARGNDLYSASLAGARPVKVTERSMSKAMAVMAQVSGLSEAQIKELLKAAETK